MAKAIFHRHQKVYVEPVGTWAVVEKVNPVWVKGFDEPVRVTYDCGLGREFLADELNAISSPQDQEADLKNWRLMRAKNKWQGPEETTHHPFPGTFPVVVTDENDWGGWRVPGAEYDRDPHLIEMQARLITNAPNLLKFAKDLRDYVRANIESCDDELVYLAKRADSIRQVIETEHATEKPHQPRVNEV